MGSLLGYLLRIRTTPAPGSTIPREVEVTGTDNGALNVNVVSGGGGGGGSGLTIQETADAMATEPLALAADSLTDFAKRTAEALEGTVPVSGPLTDTQLRATAVPVSISGGATAANQTTGNNSLSSIDGKLPALVSSRVPVVVGAALPAGTNNIGDVDVLSVPAPLSTTGGGTEATALRVTIANNSTGVLSVDDNGGSITVDGTVTVAGNYLERIADAAEDTDPVPVGILMGLGTARRVSAGSTSASEALTASGIVGVSITAVGAAVRYNINAAATATSHYLPEGQSRDFKVAPSTVIHAIRADSTDGVLEITELLA